MDISWEEARDTLREWRDTTVRDSERIVDMGEWLIRKYSSKLGDELWLVCEQVYIAALDTERLEVSGMCMKKLNANFPNSSRVRKLEAMRLEACGKYSDAKEVYDELEKEDPTNAAVRKRKVAILKSTDREEEAIKELTVYLQTFMADQDAWMELADLYVDKMDYDKAAFCVEELILSNAFNHLYHQRYAEIKYTQGGEENHRIARQYFAQAVKLSSNSNMRALYGLLLTSSNLSKSSKEANNKQYAAWAAKMISQKYSDVWAKTDSQLANGSMKLTPSEDIQQLTASVQQTLELLNVDGTNS